MKAIAMFNNKGGVGKTTVLCNLASWLSLNEHKKVLVIDADPQCNTTTYVLDDDEFLNVYYEKNTFTLNDIILPLKTRGAYIEKEKIEVVKSKGFGFDVVAGSPKLASSEDFLSGDWKDIKAQEIRGIRSNMLFFDLLRKCDEYDFVFFDMGPSLGAINRAILLACDYFITPMSSDLFSILALENIGLSLSEWKMTFNKVLANLNSEDREGLEGMKQDKSFELELWTWNEMEVPTLQRGGRYRQDKSVTYIYDIFSKKLTEVAPFTVDLLLPSGAENLNYVLYTDESPYKMQREWLDRLPFDIYSVNVHTGAKRLIGRSYRTAPKWSVNGKWAVMYDPIAQVWNKFDGATGKVVNISDAIGYPMFMESYDKPAPAPAYGIAGWTADGNNVFLYDAYDWWKIDLTGERQPECLTKGYGRKHGKSIRKMTSNIDKDVFQKDEKVIVSLWDKDTMDEGVYQLDMKGRLRKLMEGNYVYTIHRFSDNHEYCVWNRQNVSEFRDLWWSKSDFSNPVKVTNANPQQADYKWGTVKLIKWTNYENKENKGLLYLPEDYDPQKEYPALVQFYETHSGELNIYHAPLLSSALGNPMYFASNGYIVFMPDVHFTVGTPGQSCYDAVVSGGGV